MSKTRFAVAVLRDSQPIITPSGTVQSHQESEDDYRAVSFAIRADSRSCTVRCNRRPTRMDSSQTIRPSLRRSSEVLCETDRRRSSIVENLELDLKDESEPPLTGRPLGDSPRIICQQKSVRETIVKPRTPDLEVGVIKKKAEEVTVRPQTIFVPTTSARTVIPPIADPSIIPPTSSGLGYTFNPMTIFDRPRGSRILPPIGSSVTGSLGFAASTSRFPLTTSQFGDSLTTRRPPRLPRQAATISLLSSAPDLQFQSSSAILPRTEIYLVPRSQQVSLPDEIVLRSSQEDLLFPISFLRREDLIA